MSIPREVVAVGLEQDRLYAAGASLSADGTVRVQTWLSAALPKTLDVRDAGAVGAWLGSELARVGLSKARLLFAAPRGEVVVKRMRLPKAARATEADLAGMVNLQMVRQLTVPVEGTAIDYVAVGEPKRLSATEGKPSKDGATIGVLAAALPGERLEWYKEVARSAGCRIESIGLRSAGVASILAGASQLHSGPILGIAVGTGSIEFVVVESGSMVFARSADVGTGPATDAETGLVQRVGVEAKRTWMSYRVGEDSAVVDAVLVAGEGPLAREIAERCGQELEMPWKLVELPTGIDLPRSVSSLERLAAVPLLGLLADAAANRPAIDFAHPRKAPDAAAARRQRVLAAAFGLIVLGGAGWMYSSSVLSGLEKKLKEAQAHGDGLKAEYNSYLCEEARLDHLQGWTRAGADWIAHARWLSDEMPDTHEAQLDLLSGHLTSSIVFKANGGKYDAQGWQTQQSADFAIAGRTRRREISNELRDRLASSQIFTKVETKGPDLPDRFTWALSTTLASPLDTTKKPAPKAEPGGAP